MGEGGWTVVAVAMFNRYTKLRREGAPTSQEQQILTEAKTRKRLLRQRTRNTDLASRATKRIEEWMVDQSDDRAASAPINEQQSAFHFEHRERDQSKEIAAGPGLQGSMASQEARRLPVPATRDAQGDPDSNDVQRHHPTRKDQIYTAR